LPLDIDRRELKEYLLNNGIETRPMFYPVHTMPIYAQKYEKHKTAEALARRGINLPSYPSLKKADIQEIVGCIFSYQNLKDG
jgi:perosamine synthetase